MKTTDIKAYKREWYQRNREVVRARSSARYAQDPEAALDYQRERRSLDHVRELHNRQNAESRKRNPDTHRRNQANRRARKLEQFVEVVDPLMLLEIHDGICGICGNDVDPFDYEMDHVIPLVRGGFHAYSNMQLAHRTCNRRKGAHV